MGRVRSPNEPGAIEANESPERASSTELDSADMRAVQAGDHEAFANIVERHQASMFRYAAGKLGSRSVAEDAVQEAFLAAYRHRDSFDLARPLKGWLWKILLNECRRISPRRGMADLETLDPPEHRENGAEVAERLDEKRHCERMLELLPEKQATAVRLRFFGELTFEEIGWATGCSTATAKSRVRYGLSKLADLLGAEDLPRMRRSGSDE